VGRQHGDNAVGFVGRRRASRSRSRRSSTAINPPPGPCSSASSTPLPATQNVPRILLVWYTAPMREQGPIRRRRREDAPEELADRPAQASPDVAALLALQRSAGNALVQRLVWNSTSGKLVVPTEYGDKQLRWDGQRMTKDAQPRSFAELGNKDAEFKAQIKKHLGLGYLPNGVNTFSEANIQKAAPSWVDKEMSKSEVEGDQAVHAKMVHDVTRAATSHNNVLTYDGVPYKDLEEIAAAQTLVLRPEDFLPEPPDLPASGVNLVTTDIPGTDKKKYIEYACVLIALYKDDGLAKAKEITNKKTLQNDVYKVVQALHDHYVSQDPPVQYDDGSVRATMMKNWGYTMLWAGNADWAALAGDVNLPRGSYIFDITGHTVKVDVLQDIGPGTTITDPKLFFTPDSDSKNYTRGNEWKQRVTAIFKKG
jgi:hypothetical protein